MVTGDVPSPDPNPGSTSGPGWGLRTRGRLGRRLTLARVTIALIGIGLVAGLVVTRPTVRFRLAQAAEQTRQAERWRELATLSAQRKVIVQRWSITPENRGRLLEEGYDANRPYFYEWEINDISGRVSLNRSQEAYRNELTAICGERAGFHEQQSRNWRLAAMKPWAGVAPAPLMPPVDGRITDQQF